MKNRTICILITIGIIGSTAISTFAARVAFRDLPEPVKKAVQKDRDDIRKVEAFTRNGQTVYEVLIDTKGADKFVYIAPDGTRLNDTAIRNERRANLGTLKLVDLPKPVQQTFRQQAPSGKISSIDTDTLNGRTVYEIDFARAGQSEKLRINEDGSLAKKSEARLSGLDARDDSKERSQGATVASFDRPLAATQKVDFNNVPEAVKRTARAVAGSNRIEDTERGMLDGKAVYEIAFKQDGKHNELRVAEDGSIVQRLSAGEIRYPGTLSINEVPAPVRRAIREHVGSGEVNDIDKITLAGKTAYEVGFKKESGGVQHEIRIAEDGTFLGEPAGAQKK
ncbi:MAG: PepSY-like domain-containing protein [Verrucomicrobiota bacterium]